MNNTEIAKVCKAVAPRYHGVTPDKKLKWATEKVHAMTVIRGSRQLKEADPVSLETAILQAGSIGLTLNPTVGHCYLIPRKARKRRQGESDAEYKKVSTFAYASPSYRGLSHLAVAAGAVRFIQAEVIFKDDLFRYFGPHEKPDYEATLTNPAGRVEKNCTGVFALAKTKDGDYLSEYVDRLTIDKIRKMSENPNGIMWDPNKMWTEGFKKAAIRRLFKTLPSSAPTIDTAIGLLNQHEGATANDNQDHPKEHPQEHEIDAVVLLSDDQCLKLHAHLTDNGLTGSDADRWLLKLAKRFGVADYKNIPADNFKDAMDVLKGAAIPKAGNSPEQGDVSHETSDKSL